MRAPSSPLRMFSPMTIVISSLLEVIAADAEADSKMGTYFVHLSRLSSLKRTPQPSRHLRSLFRSHTTYHHPRRLGVLLRGPVTTTYWIPTVVYETYTRRSWLHSPHHRRCIDALKSSVAVLLASSAQGLVTHRLVLSSTEVRPRRLSHCSAQSSDLGC